MQFILNYKILNFCETWLTQEPNSTMGDLLNHYEMVFSSAQKDKQRGRASGGLITLIRKGLDFQVINVSNLWIIIKVFIDEESLVVANVYIPPSYDMHAALELFQDVMLSSEIQECTYLCTGGDWNARIGSSGCIDEMLADELGLNAERLSLDEASNSRGEVLTQVMESCGLLVLNGRADGDVPGHFTFVSKLGKSTVDLVWGNSEFCRAVETLVVSDALLTSDHLPVIVSTNLKMDTDADVLSYDANLINSSDSPDRYIWREESKTNFLSKINENICVEDQDNCFYHILCTKIEETAIALNLKQTKKAYQGRNYRKAKKPWFSGECHMLKKRFQNKYRMWKRNKGEEELKEYLETKSQYFELCSNLKLQYEKKIKDRLCQVKNSAEFWKTVMLFKTRPQSKCKHITLEEWFIFLQKSFPACVQNQSLVFIDVLRPDLDSDFCRKELDDGIAHLKNGKSPGPDNILNEYLKCLGDEWRQKLLIYFNNLFNKGVIPDSMLKSFFFMLHKKGDSKDPDNYRSIALMNNLLKLLTQMLNTRMMFWCENNVILTECQSGFRSGRGCVDNIFSLSSIINLHLMSGRKLYAALIDFKAAFSEVNHDLLWAKLFSAGISAKIIRLLRNIYSFTTVQIKIDNLLTPPAAVTKGVLQGESASPLLFLLFLNDLEEYFRLRGARGVPINESTEINLLCYADDLILFSSDRIDLQHKLNWLQDYCVTNKMIVNTKKSKVLIFRQGGKLSRFDRFHYNNEDLVICSEYNYLGITFSSRGVFFRAATEALSKGKLAVANVRKIMCNSKMDSWDSRMQLYNSVVKATLLYSAEVWGFRYGDLLEKCQAYFFKSIFCLARNTPNYALRLEMGVVKLSYFVFRQVLAWWCKLLKMSDCRIPKVCYNQLKKVDELRSYNSPRYNWVTQLKIQLCSLGYEGVWRDPSQVENNFKDILNKYYLQLIEQDWESLSASNYFGPYKELKPRLMVADVEDKTTSLYLLWRTPIDRTRVAAQLRLCGTYVKFYIGNIGYSWDGEELCSICNMQAKETLSHFLTECPQYSPIRAKFLGNILQQTGDATKNLLSMQSREAMNNVYYFVKSALKIRAFIVQE